MRTPTLVVAIILAMAMAGDSANIERLLRHLRLLAGEETIDEATMTHTKGKSVDTEETQLLDLVKKLSLESKEPEPIDGDVNGEGDTDVDPNYEMAETQDPTLKDFSGEKVPDVEENYDMAGLGDQNPTSEEGEAEGDEVTEQNYDQSETGEEYSTSTDGSEQAPDFRQNYDMTGFQNQDPTSEGAEEEGSTDVEQNYDVAKIGEKDSTLKEDEQAPDVGQNYGMTGREDQDPTSKEVGGEKGPDVEQKYDMTGREDPDQSLRADSNNAFTCRQCRPGHACKLREEICPAGTASNDNRTMCVPCAAGEFSSAPGAASCQKCPAGKYSTCGGSTSCLDCPTGKYSEAVGSTGCKICPAGQYSSTAASSGCTSCPAGQYSSRAGSSGCTSCPAGQYSSRAGSSGCTSCPAGQYSSRAESSGCTSCPAGQYSSTAGSDGCTNCPAGQYSSTAGSDGCTDCPAGQYSSTAGSDGCTNCPRGYTTTSPGRSACAGCKYPLGMESGAILDDSITASSFWDKNFDAYRGRLNGVAGAGAWAAETNTIGEWLQVDLGEKKRVTGTIIQGRYRNHDQWVTSYKLQYSVDGRRWVTCDGSKNFPGNTDRNTPVTNLLDSPIDARYVRFLPQSWKTHMSMRVEVLGCSLNVCKYPLGMESGTIPDDSITASSFWGDNLETYRGRLNGVTGGGAWAAETNTIGEWLQVDLGEKKRVTGTIIQGRNRDYPQWVTSYKLQYSVDGRRWVTCDGSKNFPGNTDRNTPVTNLLDSPIGARYVRFLPQTWKTHMSMRVEVLGCSLNGR
ncbi:uncharacterized protein LOC144924635 isoform X2 [Branchiostoma floridae x Branchiostoma belcheri]